MPRVEEIHAFLEEIAPCALAEEWDNVGTLVDCGREVSGVMTALDITGTTIAEAAEAGCELIVSHHPVIFHPLRRWDCTDPCYQMIRRQISGICMHTNLDTAAGGVNDQLAALFGLGEVRALEQMGRVGRLPAPMDPRRLRCSARRSSARRGCSSPTPGRPIRTLAVLGGAGGEFAAAAKAAGADCLLTGEASHHDALGRAADRPLAGRGGPLFHRAPGGALPRGPAAPPLPRAAGAGQPAGAGALYHPVTGAGRRARRRKVRPVMRGPK